jgi:hypothetical protein
MNETPRFRIVPLALDFAAAIRASHRNGLENSLSLVRDGAPHQCRCCLDLSAPDEGVILLSHRPFASAQPYAEVGPIFIHERDCSPYADPHRYPPEFPRDAVVLRAYDVADRIVGAQVVGDRAVESVIEGLFDSEETAYLHARNVGYGCFMFRVDRP